MSMHRCCRIVAKCWVNITGQMPSINAWGKPESVLDIMIEIKTIYHVNHDIQKFSFFSMLLNFFTSKYYHCMPKSIDVNNATP